MSLPVSQYEALLAEVRGLRRKAQRVQQLATPLISINSTTPPPTTHHNQYTKNPPYHHVNYEVHKMESLAIEISPNGSNQYELIAGSSAEGDTTCSEEEYGGAPSTHLSVSSEPISQSNRGMSVLYHGTWPVERTMWNSEPNNLGPRSKINTHNDMTSVMSFASSSGGAPLDRVLSSSDRSRRSSQQLEAKMDMVNSLLAILGGQEHADMGETLLALSTSPDSCVAMRQSGCIPLLVQLAHSDKDPDTRKKASEALSNLVHVQPDEKLRKRESRILKLLDQTRKYVEALQNNLDYRPETPSEDGDNHPIQTVAHVMKLSFDEGHRQAICQLGGIDAIADIVEIEHALHGSTTDETHCVLLRRYACMALTNLTFGDSGNKALLCSCKDFMRALVLQLHSPSDELRQVTASVLRNLSWRADPSSKEVLREVGAVTGLMKSAMLDNRENTSKSILSALWNLSAHCTENKSEICAIDQALGFLVDMLSYKSVSKSLAIIENSGGILRNISSQIAVRDDYRDILREHNCLEVLLDQLKSPSLTIVSNACGTLWNLSAKCAVDQEALWQMGAPAMLRSLNHSKHKMIAMGSSAALKNLLSSRPSHNIFPQMDSTAKAMDLPILPTLGARKQKALLQDLDQNLSETFENIERDPPIARSNLSTDKTFSRSESDECVTHTDLVYQSRTSLSDTSIRNDDSVISAFDNLSINEPSTSYQSGRVRNRSKIPQSFSNTSYSKRSVTPCYIPVQSKYSDCDYDEADPTEQAINFSRTYLELKRIEDEEIKRSIYPFNGKPVVKMVKNLGMYTETDLDQPTDYSLRYAEDSDCEDIGSKITQDTVKTYCTEDTPYETPFNFSTATSMSDLRETASDSQKQDIDNDRLVNVNVKDTKNPAISNLDEKDHCSVEDISEIESRPKMASKVIKSEFSSGLMSPEKPVNYCDEGTPGCFSRVSSFGSLNSLPANEVMKTVQQGGSNLTTANLEYKNDQKNENAACEAKVVKVEQVLNYAEETPLMFSRSSSLASLNSIEQHSIHDDRSSVVSDFSRLTSGIISPSELPDSPTQTVPPSPKQRKNPLEYRTKTTFNRTPTDGRPQPAPRLAQKPSVFEDNVTKFKEESTPVQFSTANSLSSLGIDDESTPNKVKINSAPTIPPSGMADEACSLKKIKEKCDEEEKQDSSSEINDELPPVSENEEDEDILAACISDGMQNNRHRQIKNSKFMPSSDFKYEKVVHRPASSGIPIVRSGIPSRPLFEAKTDLHDDTLHRYCTEDTPAQLSHAGSNSNLSSITNEAKFKDEKNYLSDDSSNLSAENENILAECIQSALPKPKNIIGKPALPRVVCNLPMRSMHASTPIKPFVKPELKICKEVYEKKSPLTYTSFLAANDETASYAVENSPCVFSLRSSLSDLTIDGVSTEPSRLNQHSGNENENTFYSGTFSHSSISRSQLKSHGASGSQSLPNESFNNIGPEQNENLSREESVSSLSVESVSSLETEQALLEQCISSGMPKSKRNVTPNKSQEINKTSNVPKPVGVATKQFIHVKNKNHEDSKKNLITSQSKNAYVASAAGNTTEKNEMCRAVPTTVADVERTEELEKSSNHAIEELRADTSRVNCSPTETNFSMHTKNGCRNSGEFDSCNDTTTSVDTRMLDPDAMIESLERYTAELICQSAHLTKNEGGYSRNVWKGDAANKIAQSPNNASVADGNTWNEDTSPNDVTFPSISGSVPHIITFSSEVEAIPVDYDDQVEVDEVDGRNKSNDFSSVNSSTMTDSTLIAMEATKMVAAFKSEVMVQSVTSVASLELDNIQPPSYLNSLSNSVTGLEIRSARSSPKLNGRKKSIPVGLLARRALSNSLHQTSSVDSLEISISNLDHINPPSAMGELLDMDGSMFSIASLKSEVAEFRPDFIPNGTVTKDAADQPNPIFNVKQPTKLLHLLSNNSHNHLDLENINPPSLFNEISDSLADLATDTICSETEVFEDCQTHVVEAIQTEDDVTEFSDANSSTPLQSDLGSSSAESTPKKSKTVQKRLTPKQRRNLVQERYKTYIIGAEMIISEESKKSQDDSTTDDFKTVDCFSDKTLEQLSDSPTLSVRSSGKTTPKDRRQQDRARFQTQVLDEAITSALRQQIESLSPPPCSPVRSKLSIRRNFMQKRLENKDRFKTRTLSESSLSPEISGTASPPTNDSHYLVHKEANLVLKILKETKANPDELLDCETLSLVSNEDDSEHNSGCSVNYRTYTKSWSSRPNEIPVVKSVTSRVNVESINTAALQYEVEEDKFDTKPKIIKPDEIVDEVVEEAKAIRGRRKPLYSKVRSPQKVKDVSSSLVKNVTSTLKAGTSLKAIVTKQNKATKPIVQPKSLKPPSGYSKVASNSLKPGSPSRIINSKISKSGPPSKPSPAPLERQGTFTKEEVVTAKSRIPTPASFIKPPMRLNRTTEPQTTRTSKLQQPTSRGANSAPPLGRRNLITSNSTDRASKLKSFNRSPSADSKELNYKRNIQNSASSQSLKNENSSGTIKRSSIPNIAQRSSSNSSITSNGSGSKKLVTSKIASLWKKVEESKKLPAKKDNRVWIQAQSSDRVDEPQRLIRSNTFESKNGVSLKGGNVVHISRLDSFTDQNSGLESEISF